MSLAHDIEGPGNAVTALEGANLLGVPLDRHREWYHYHYLFRDLLGAELERREPELIQQLQARAAAWCEANGLPELAIDHALAGEDADRAARLVASLAFPAYASGRAQTARQWFQWFAERGLLERYPLIALQGAFLQVLTGQPEDIERWAGAAERGSTTRTLSQATMEPWMALLRALLCRDGVDQMRADAEAAAAGLAPGSPWWATALLLQGIADVLAGEADRADPILADAAEVATRIGALPAASAALAQRALVAIARHDWMEAETLAERALEIARIGQLNDYEMSPLLHAVAARTALRRGEIPRAQEHLARAMRRRPLVTSAAVPYRAVQTRLELARAHLALTDVAGARTLLREARYILQQRPNLGILPSQAALLQSKLDSLRETTTSAAPLTNAELRLLPLMSTHLTFREMGERLYLSPHTVKSQALSVYRKLGVSSRSQAIQRARQTGLLGAMVTTGQADR